MKNGIGEYAKLTKSTEAFHQKLFALLCRTMAHDSFKHIGILDFLRLTLQTRRAAGTNRKNRVAV